MSGPNREKARHSLRSWSPIFLGSDGTQPPSLVAWYRSILQQRRAQTPTNQRTWRTGVLAHYAALSTIVCSFLSLFRPPPPAFYRLGLTGERPVLSPSYTVSTPHKKATAIAPPKHRSEAKSYLLPSPWKLSQWSETPSRGLLRTSQIPNDDGGVQRCGIGCLCSRCYHYRSWF